MQENEYDIRVIKTAPHNELLALYYDAGWIKPEDKIPEKMLEKIVSQSFCFIGIFHRGHMIGMGRALSDGISDAYIQDVTILKKYRGKGLGKKVILSLINHLKSNGIEWIALIGEPGTKEFYRPLGFDVMHDYIPMKLKT